MHASPIVLPGVPVTAEPLVRVALFRRVFHVAHVPARRILAEQPLHNLGVRSTPIHLVDELAEDIRERLVDCAGLTPVDEFRCGAAFVIPCVSSWATTSSAAGEPITKGATFSERAWIPERIVLRGTWCLEAPSRSALRQSGVARLHRCCRGRVVARRSRRSRQGWWKRHPPLCRLLPTDPRTALACPRKLRFQRCRWTAVWHSSLARNERDLGCRRIDKDQLIKIALGLVTKRCQTSRFGPLSPMTRGS